MAVADRHRLFLWSASFTEYPIAVNTELSLVITGGKLPGQVEKRFEQVIDAGHLAPAKR